MPAGCPAFAHTSVCASVSIHGHQHSGEHLRRDVVEIRSRDLQRLRLAAAGAQGRRQRGLQPQREDGAARAVPGDVAEDQRQAGRAHLHGIEPVPGEDPLRGLEPASSVRRSAGLRSGCSARS